MENELNNIPAFIFETSWEVCNKVGGIHTVLSTKALSIVNEYKDNYILIGPDVYRDTKEHPEFIEYPELFKWWKDKANEEGLHIRIGRWNIKAAPIVILIDITTFYALKDEIFIQFWEDYKLDSLSGQWDYIEPAVFGFAAGKLIESFCKYNLNIKDNVIAHFHEWMSGAGILYLKAKAPQISTVFTTHATIAGRSIAGNGLPLYSNIEKYNGDIVARDFNVLAKQSLEKLSAHHSDVFTTVSEITAKECSQFLEKNVTIVTPNGFDDTIIPEGKELNSKRKVARDKFIKVASTLLNLDIKEDTLLIATGGRYEFKNKGIDLYIEALGKLNKNKKLKKDIIAFILVPADNYGPRKDLLEKLESNQKLESEQTYLTHGLHYSESDPALNLIAKAGLSNSKDDRVKIIFVPSYLKGNDGIFNMPYYDLLLGLDLTVFASYYEPWGYTPLESIAFNVPTVTTSLTGFGAWVTKETKSNDTGVDVIERTDTNDEQVIDSIENSIFEFINKDKEEQLKAKQSAGILSKKALWENFINYYKTSYTIALENSKDRKQEFVSLNQTEYLKPSSDATSWNQPHWKKVEIVPHLPQELKALNEIANNMWWCWNYEALELFEYIDPKLWIINEQNPLALLSEVSASRLNDLINDHHFIGMYNDVVNKFTVYMDKVSERKEPRIAYFSMEFGLHDSVKIFSGGLGILAGDYLKEASDHNVDMIGVGLLYKHGYFKQVLTVKGEQLATYIPQRFSKMPIKGMRHEDGTWKTITIQLPGRTLTARIWRVEVGRIPLYLLDTDLDENIEEDRSITSELYGGDWENRLKQEILLGIGGIRLLDQMNVKPHVYHCNEGHAAFIAFERLHRLQQKRNFTFAESQEIIKSSTLFTTHTPVPAGHDSFDEPLLRKYLAHYPERLKISWDDLINLGKEKPSDPKFSMSYLAMNMSQETNGVSWLHGEVTKDMFANKWKGYFPEELHIGYVTNGVHYPTWTAKNWRNLYERTFDCNFMDDQSNKDIWKKIYDVPDSEIWEIKTKQRKILIDYLKQRIRNNWLNRYENPRKLVEVVDNLKKNALTIGFARRFATYKRAYLLFKNIDRLLEIVSNEKMPVQFLFAGKAHPHDKGGQDLIKYIIEISKRPEFLGKIVFLEDYDIELAKKLVQGVDIWMNTPTRPLEASGTSGMKAVMNGTLHFSVLDGWWVEGYKEDAGWYLPAEQSFENPDFQDELDSETIYSLLENKIVPLFYYRNHDNVPVDWVRYMKNSLAQVAPEFTTKRMIDDYIERFYTKLYTRTIDLKKNDYKKALEVAAERKTIQDNWYNIEIVSATIPDIIKNPLKLGETFKSDIVVDLKGLSDNEIGIELIIARVNKKGEIKIESKHDYALNHTKENHAHFDLSYVLSIAGDVNFGIRLYAKSPNIPHRQDLNLVRWL